MKEPQSSDHHSLTNFVNVARKVVHLRLFNNTLTNVRKPLLLLNLVGKNTTLFESMEFEAMGPDLDCWMIGGL